jgi:hypothetical protein
MYEWFFERSVAVLMCWCVDVLMRLGGWCTCVLMCCCVDAHVLIVGVLMWCVLLGCCVVLLMSSCWYGWCAKCWCVLFKTLNTSINVSRARPPWNWWQSFYERFLFVVITTGGGANNWKHLRRAN